jgi:hypothetical protein
MSMAVRRAGLAYLVLASSLGLALSTEHDALTSRCPTAAVMVPAGADLHAYIEDGQARTYCLAAGRYELGSTSLKPDSGDRLAGPPVSVGPRGEILARAFIHGTDDTGVIENINEGATLSIANLDISGACCSSGEGSDGINGGHGMLINLTVSYSRLHNNSNGGILGVAQGLRVDHSEIDHNGSGNNGYDAGIKTVNYAVVTNSYFHDNDPNGMWWDCDAPGGVFTNNRVARHQRSGVFVEISSGDSSSPRPIPSGASYGFVIARNTLSSNNLEDSPAYGGLSIVSSMNVDAGSNTITQSLNYDVYLHNDSRAGDGHDRCSSGFPLANVSVHDTLYGPAGFHGCDFPGVSCVDDLDIRRRLP